MVTVGTSVLVGGYHRPVELAQRLATIDVLSGGRLVVGLSVGLVERRARADGRHARTAAAPASRSSSTRWSLAGAPTPSRSTASSSTSPAAEIDPKPVQQPRPPLISGLWGPVGLRRTARAFDGWNPARRSRPSMAVWRGWRPAADPTAWRRSRSGTARSCRRPGGPPSPDMMFAQIAEAKELGFREVIIDANFSEGITSPQAWLDVLDLLAPAL